MKKHSLISFSFLLLLVALFAMPTGLAAQQHVVTSDQIHNDVAATAATRAQNRATLENFFGSEKAQQALKAAHIDPKQVTTAVSKLNDDDLARLSLRAQNAQRDFAAGNMSDHDLLVILIVVAVIVLIIVAVHH